MEKLTHDQLKKILKVFNDTQKGIIKKDEVDEAYDLLPEKQIQAIATQTKVATINRLVIFNYNNIMNKLNNYAHFWTLDPQDLAPKPKEDTPEAKEAPKKRGRKPKK